MKEWIGLVIAGLLLLSVSVKATGESENAPPRNRLSSADQTFLQEAAQASHAEIALGQLAREQGRGADVKKMGEQLVNEHKALLRDLQQLAAGEGVMLPARPDAAQASQLKALALRRGEVFDQLFIAQTLRLYQDALLLYEQTALGKGNTAIRDWAAERLPQIRRHVSAIREQYPEAIGERLEPQTSSENR